MNCKNTSKGCVELPLPKGLKFNSLDEMVEWYEKKRLGKIYCYLKKYKTLLDCITGAPGENHMLLPSSLDPDVPRYKKGSHQRRLTNKVINDVHKKYKNLNLNPENFSDFDTYIDNIRENKVDGFGLTCTYDYCINSGYKYGLMPKEKVYIHTGPSFALDALRKLQLVTDNVKNDRINLTSLPESVQKLDAFHAEDFLCVFHPHLTDLANNQSNKSI